MNRLNTFFFLLLLLSAVVYTSCVDNDFDEPENTFMISEDAIIPISTILDLVPAFGATTLSAANLGRDSVYIKGTITADDASGNFFKTVTFQDATAALSIMADRNELNAQFPEGNNIYILLNGLVVGKDANLPRIAYSFEDSRLQRIPDLLVNDYMVAAGKGEEITPDPATISQILQNPQSFYNRLVTLDEAQFSIEYVGQTYADAMNPDGPETVNAIIEDCDGNEIILRNSGFADFANEPIPIGSGPITVIASVFNDDLQLFIRDLDDVQFGTTRCDGSGGQAANEITIQSIQDIHYMQAADEVPAGFITGTVISDRTTGQFNGQNVVVQNGEDGILVRFSSAHSFNLGDQLKITVTGQELSQFREVLQINNVPLFNAERTGTGTLPTPTKLSVSDILANNNMYESTRVLLEGVNLSGGPTFGNGATVEDGGSIIDIFTFNTTSFANASVPTGTVDVTAIVSQFDDEIQLLINDPSDISGGTVDPGGNGGEGSVDQTFEGFGDFDPVMLTGWLNIATKGDRQWYTRSFDNNGFVECEAFNDDNPATEAWLVTPTIDTDIKSMFSFESAIAFWQHQGLSVWVSQDFTDLNSANWIKLTEAQLANNSNANYVFVASGDIDLKDYLGGKVRVGFKYEGTSASNTTKVRLDNVMLK